MVLKHREEVRGKLQTSRFEGIVNLASATEQQLTKSTVLVLASNSGAHEAGTLSVARAIWHFQRAFEGRVACL